MPESTVEEMQEQTPAPSVTNFFPTARQAWLERHRPFFASDKRYRPNAAMTHRTATVPHPADYDPNYNERHFDPAQIPKTEEQAKAFQATKAQQLLQEAFNREQYTLADLTPYRIRVAYRIVRHLALATRACSKDESLAEALEVRTFLPSGEMVDPWYMSRNMPQAMHSNELIKIHLYKLMYPEQQEILNEITESNETVAALLTLKSKDQEQKITLLPPPIPVRWYNSKTLQVHDCYDPSDYNHDQGLHNYVAIFNALYTTMNIQLGSKKFPLYGEYGIQGINDIFTIRQSFPSTGELLAFESILIGDTLQLLTEKGSAATIRELEYEYGFNSKEATGVVAMARSHAKDIAGTDVDQEKNILVLKIEDCVRRSREAFNLTSELQGLKLLALVQGITRAEPNDYNTEVRDLIRKWEEPTPRKSVPNHIKLPPAPMIPTEAPV